MAWPVDGRGRGAPRHSDDATPEQEFQDRFVDLAVRTALAKGRGFAFPDGLDRAQARLFHATYLQHFSFFAWKFPSWLLAIASLCPHQDVRRSIIEDCVDEEVGDVDAAGRCHVDVLYEEAEACGISRAEIAATEPTPIVLACVHALENFSRTLGWETGFAAIAGLEILQSEPAVKRRNELLSESFTPEELARQSSSRSPEGLAERTGVPADQLAFQALHAYKDQFHGGGELALIVKYGTTRAIQESMLWGAKSGIEVYCVMRAEINRLCREAVGLPPSEQLVAMGVS